MSVSVVKPAFPAHLSGCGLKRLPDPGWSSLSLLDPGLSSVIHSGWRSVNGVSVFHFTFQPRAGRTIRIKQPDGFGWMMSAALMRSANASGFASSRVQTMIPAWAP